MTDQYPKGNEPTAKIEVESKDRGMFTFLGKKEEKPQEDVAMTDCEMTHVPEPAEKKEMVKPTLGSELHRFRSSSSSSSDEEGGERKKKKKGLKEKMKEKMSGQGEEGITEVAVENAEMTNSEEKKGILEKIKEKIPAQHKKSEEGATTTAHDGVSAPETGAKEKKGIMEKIKEKLPGYHKNGEEEKKES